MNATSGDQSPKRAEDPDKTGMNHGPRIVIDPGHGGEDLGAQGVGGLLEKDVTLSVALELADLLNKRASAQVKLTRTKDIFVPLAKRRPTRRQFSARVPVA
ncbi:MAG: N-acetylmuramoyl-L-alanine amidase, partial [Proteobacteria bacterium]|nr:N-acetylmuramoyl-L-alanine amidase [Pseudomonadota bacterium]